MTNEREIFLKALDQPSTEERRAYLDEACGQDPDLRQRIDALLRSHEDAPNAFLKPNEPATTALPAQPPELDHPESFGDYRILNVIAQGGMGVVYRAYQKSLSREVALKTILAGRFASEIEVERFQTEARAAANLDHPGIVPIYEVGERESLHYYAMPLIRGESLAARVARGPLDPTEAARILEQAADALAYAHSEGVIHRDVKPANILLDVNGAVRITDFGLAKSVSDAQGLTQTGQVLGTPGFMAPEQAEAQARDAKPTVDVYGLGAVLYNLTTGRPPFQSDSTLETLRLVKEELPLSPRLLNPKIPRDLETICLKCLEKQPQRRYVGIAELRADLRRLLAGETIHAKPVGHVTRALRWSRRRPTAAVACILATVLFCTLVGAYAVTSQANRKLSASLYANQVANAYTEIRRGNRNEAFWMLASAPDSLRKWEWRFLSEQVAPPDVALPSETYRLLNRRVVNLDTIPNAEKKQARRSMSNDGKWISEVISGDRIRVTNLNTGKHVELEGAPKQSSSSSVEGFTPDSLHFVTVVYEAVQRNSDGANTRSRRAPTYRQTARAWRTDDWTLVQEVRDDVIQRAPPSPSRLYVASIRKSDSDSNGQSLVIRSVLDGLEVLRRPAKYFKGNSSFRSRSSFKRINYGDKWVIFKPENDDVTLASGEQDVSIFAPSPTERFLGSVFNERETLAAIGIENTTTRGVTVYIFEVNSGRRIASLDSARSVSMATFAPDDRHVVLGQAQHDTMSSELAVWDLKTSQLASILRPHSEPTSDEQAKQAWRGWVNWANRLLPGFGGSVPLSPSILWGSPMQVDYQHIAFSRDGRFLHAQSLKHTHTWRLSSGPQPLMEPANRVVFADDNTSVIVGTTEPKRTENGPRVGPLDASRLVTVADLRNEGLSDALPPNRSLDLLLGLQPPSKSINSGAARQTVSRVQSRNTEWIAEYTTPKAIPLMGFAGEGELIVWRSSDPANERAFSGHGVITALAISNDGALLATAAYQEVPHDLSIFSMGVDLGVDARRRGSIVSVWDRRSGRRIARFQSRMDLAMGVAISPDNSRLAIVGKSSGLLGHTPYDREGGEVSIWDIAGRQRLLTLQTTDAGLASVAFSPDGNRLAAAGRALHLWNGTPMAEQRQRLRKQITHLARIQSTPSKP